jgi:cobyrinic acid a,c-diamide synthase
MCSEDAVREIFAEKSFDADISVVEGAMGILDGVFAEDFYGSSAHVANVLKIPVLLVLDCSGSSFTPSAMVKGLNELLETDIKAVVLNNIASERHEFLVRSAIEKYTDVKVIGSIPKNPEQLLGSRHLGIKTAFEVDEQYLDNCAEIVRMNIDTDTLLEITESEVSIPVKEKTVSKTKTAYVAYDEAFQFYYNSNIEWLENQGLDIKYFSPLNGDKIEDADFVYLGGGYPEIHAEKLSKNITTLSSVKEYVENGGILYAECGGLMYLTNGIYVDDVYYPMAGVIDADCRMCKRRQALGYARATLKNDCIMGKAGQSNIGHEFHYSALENYDGDFVYSLERVSDGKKSEDGILYKNCFAAYTHMHFLSDGTLVGNMIKNIFNSNKEG